MENTSGFYKKLEDSSWLYAQNEVVAPNYTISRNRYEKVKEEENKEGWIWYDEAPKEYLEWKDKQLNSLFEQINLMLNE